MDAESSGIREDLLPEPNRNNEPSEEGEYCLICWKIAYFIIQFFCLIFFVMYGIFHWFHVGFGKVSSKCHKWVQWRENSSLLSKFVRIVLFIPGYALFYSFRLMAFTFYCVACPSLLILSLLDKSFIDEYKDYSFDLEIEIIDSKTVKETPEGAEI